MVKATIKLLGMRGKDKVTGFSGMVGSVCFDAYGCVQVALTPPVDADGKPRDGHWFDVQRIDFSEERVMPVPDFEGRASAPKTPQTYDHGPAEKPSFQADPCRR
jgi:hypothetical protein